MAKGTIPGTKKRIGPANSARLDDRHRRALRALDSPEQRNGRRGRAALDRKIRALHRSGPAALIELLNCRDLSLDTLDTLCRLVRKPCWPWLLEHEQARSVLMMCLFLCRAVAVLVSRRSLQDQHVIGTLGVGHEVYRDHRRHLVSGDDDREGRAAGLLMLDHMRDLLNRVATTPDPWLARLRRCPSPRCVEGFFWDATVGEVQIYHDDACRKAHKRAEP